MNVPAPDLRLIATLIRPSPPATADLNRVGVWCKAAPGVFNKGLTPGTGRVVPAAPCWHHEQELAGPSFNSGRTLSSRLGPPQTSLLKAPHIEQTQSFSESNLNSCPGHSGGMNPSSYDSGSWASEYWPGSFCRLQRQLVHLSHVFQVWSAVLLCDCKHFLDELAWRLFGNRGEVGMKFPDLTSRSIAFCLGVPAYRCPG